MVDLEHGTVLRKLCGHPRSVWAVAIQDSVAANRELELIAEDDSKSERGAIESLGAAAGGAHGHDESRITIARGGRTSGSLSVMEGGGDIAARVSLRRKDDTSRRSTDGSGAAQGGGGGGGGGGDNPDEVDWADSDGEGEGVGEGIHGDAAVNADAQGGAEKQPGQGIKLGDEAPLRDGAEDMKPPPPIPERIAAQLRRLVIASGDRGGHVVVWDPLTGLPLSCRKGHRGQCTRIALDAPSGIMLSAGHGDQSLVRWKLGLRGGLEEDGTPTGIIGMRLDGWLLRRGVLSKTGLILPDQAHRLEAAEDAAHEASRALAEADGDQVGGHGDGIEPDRKPDAPTLSDLAVDWRTGVAAVLESHPDVDPDRAANGHRDDTMLLMCVRSGVPLCRLPLRTTLREHSSLSNEVSVYSHHVEAQRLVLHGCFAAVAM